MNKKKSCATCKKRNTCKELCKEMVGLLENHKNNNGIYSDKTIYAKECPFSDKLDNIFFTIGLSKIQHRDSKRIIIAILNPRQKKLLALFCDGLRQKDIAKELGVSQSTVSQSIKNIRTILKQSYTEIIAHII